MSAAQTAVRKGEVSVEVIHFDKHGNFKSGERATKKVTYRVDEQEQVVEILTEPPTTRMPNKRTPWAFLSTLSNFPMKCMQWVKMLKRKPVLTDRRKKT